ncbi:MAG: hypothetical protein PHF05_00005 [Candidatus Izemoplasmatales bacterium]|nr:hypothetical protein [Candidatus Izemoplasmatales bacterium]
MKEYVKEFCLIGIPTLLIVILFMQFIAVKNVAKINRGLKNEIEYLESRVETYENNEAWFEDYIDLLEEIWEQEVEIAVLEERLKNQPSNEEYIEQIIDDFELVIELQQHYYQENITSHSFGDWLQINYPALYERLLNYF